MPPDIPQTPPADEQPEGNSNEVQPEGAQEVTVLPPTRRRHDFDWDTLDEPIRDHIVDLRNEAKWYRVQAQEIKDQLTALTAWKETMEAQQLEQLQSSGNYQEVAAQHAKTIAQLQPKAQRVDQLEELIRASNTKRIERLQGKAKDAVMALNLLPDQLAAWLDEYADALSTPTPPPSDGGRGVQGGTKPVPVAGKDKDIAAYLISQGINVTAEGLARRRALRGETVEE